MKLGYKKTGQKNPEVRGFLGDAVVTNFTYGSVTVSAVPLPTAVWLLASGLGFIGFFQRRES